MARKEGIKTQGLRIKIRNKASIINFNALLGFRDFEKQRKLSGLISRWEESTTGALNKP
jgi:hypothetical protein